MLNYIWLGLVVLAVVIGGCTDRLKDVADKAFEMAEFAVMRTALPLVGIMALWLGVMRLAERAGLVALLMVIGVALAVAYPQLPDIASLTDYRPKLPMRVFSSDGVLLGEFGEERRNLTPIAQIPQVMKDAVLAAEDALSLSRISLKASGSVLTSLPTVMVLV